MSTSSPAQAWSELSSHLSKWFYRPDLEALRIIYSAVAAHHLPKTEPIWPIVIAPPSSGKTSIAVSPLLALENSHLIGSMTPQTLLSGRAGKQSSLLHRIGPSGFMIMKDFGTFLSMRENDRNEIMSQFREVYDGEFGRQGGSGNIVPWSGKITIVAASTQAVDRAWSFQHDLGERFTNIRWRTYHNRAAGRFACSQIDDERLVKDETRRLVRALFDARPMKMPPALSSDQQEQIVDLAMFVAKMRCTVVRDSLGKREIIDVGEPEGITRLHKTYSLLARFHASLFGNGLTIEDSDLSILRRVAVEAVRPSRWNFLRAIPMQGDIARVDLQKSSGIPSSTVAWIADELTALGLIEQYSESEQGYALTTVSRAILGGSKLDKTPLSDLDEVRLDQSAQLL